MASRDLSCFSSSHLAMTRMRTPLLIGGGQGHLHRRLLRLGGRSARGTVAACLGDDQGFGEAPASASPRRSANYQPTLWGDSFIQTLTSDRILEAGDAVATVEELKGEVRGRIIGGAGRATAATLDLLDAVRRLGVAYLFEQEMEVELHFMSARLEDVLRELDGDLHHTALLFRLLREHAFPVPPDVFNRFVNADGSLKRCVKEDDMEGILSLYEASFLTLPEEEKTLDKARAFATERLKEFLIRSGRDGAELTNMRERVAYALEMPLHWRVPRLYVRRFIDMYEREATVSSALLEFAKVDSDMVQSVHQRDAKKMSRWWNDTGLNKLHFARDRILECFLWSSGTVFEPQFSLCICGLTQIIALITTIDDVYDVYGTIDELESFTHAIERWDLDATKELPDYMKPCFQIFLDTINELAVQCYGRNSFDCLPYLKKSWVDFCKCQLQEAKWYHSKYVPTLQEYLENACVSIAGPVILTHAYFMLSENVTEEDVDSIARTCDLIRCSSKIIRLNDDLGTSEAEIERGDVPKSIQCHMHHSNIPEVTAREHIQTLIHETWKLMNHECFVNKHFPKLFVRTAANLARTAQFFYQYGDGLGVPDKETKDNLRLLLIEPIQRSST